MSQPGGKPRASEPLIGPFFLALSPLLICGDDVGWPMLTMWSPLFTGRSVSGGAGMVVGQFAIRGPRRGIFCGLRRPAARAQEIDKKNSITV